ncbi:hypothetical protein C1890_15805 [Pseudomonas sp. DP16D-R1]|nr:hypothetical protein C1890_15805 [Pseudomonas sp. DP16D-R1]
MVKGRLGMPVHPDQTGSQKCCRLGLLGAFSWAAFKRRAFAQTPIQGASADFNFCVNAQSVFDLDQEEGKHYCCPINAITERVQGPGNETSP